MLYRRRYDRMEWISVGLKYHPWYEEESAYGRFALRLFYFGIVTSLTKEDRPEIMIPSEQVIHYCARQVWYLLDLARVSASRRRRRRGISYLAGWMFSWLINFLTPTGTCLLEMDSQRT